MTERIECPEPGVYRGVGMEDYLAWGAASNSRLGRLVRSPAHMKAYLEEPPKETPALVLGRAIHAAVFEPEDFESTYRRAEQCVATTSRGAQCSRDGTWPLAGGGAVCTQHASGFDLDEDAVTLSTSDHETCESVRAAIEAHPVAAGFLRASGDSEVSIVWDDPETGVRVKGRWDRYLPELPGVRGGTIMDLKTTRDASTKAFERSIVTYGYARQAALYLMGAKALGMDVSSYAILAAEKTPPYALAIYRITENTFGPIPEPGEQAFHMVRHVQALLARYGHCMATGDFPGYPPDVRDVSLPDWAWSELDRTTEAAEAELAA